MKQPTDMNALNATRVAHELQSAGVNVTAHQSQLLVAHARAVLDANQALNLTRIVEADDVIRLHIVDSLAFLTRVPTVKGVVYDIGSGAGYPGLPLAILGYDVGLCESVKKKAAFLTATVESLGLEVPVWALRAEELAEARPQTARVVTARAVSSLASLVELAAPLLEIGGVLMALKGNPEDVEQARGSRAAKICGMRLVESTRYAVPGADARTVFLYEKIGQSKLRLPRRPGIAQTHPLG